MSGNEIDLSVCLIDFSREAIISKEFFITKVIESFISLGNLKEDLAAT